MVVLLKNTDRGCQAMSRYDTLERVSKGSLSVQLDSANWLLSGQSERPRQR